MVGKNKFISSLDLKYLGAKFLTIPDSHLEMCSSLSEIRKTRDNELPSILKEMPCYFEGTPEGQNYEEPSRKQKVSPKTQVPRHSNVGRRMGENEYTGQQKKQIAKYRSLINKIKLDNEIMHKEITKMYREKKFNDNEPKTRTVRTILQAAREIPALERKCHLSPQAKQYEHIYERLGSEQNPYRKESVQIQKKFANNNLHKNFEAFLISHNKRVPEFIKNIR